MIFTKKMLEHWKQSAVDAMESLSPTCTQDTPAEQIVSICETALLLIDACGARDKAAKGAYESSVSPEKPCGYCNHFECGEDCPTKQYPLSRFKELSNDN
jgi:hypothetical protein